MRKSKKERSLTGRWEFRNIESPLSRKKKRFGGKARENLRWDFSEPEQKGNQQIGNLTEIAPDGTVCTTSYVYDAASRKLYLDRSYYADDGFIEMAIEDIYFVKFTLFGRLWLTDKETATVLTLKRKSRF